jgi:hypothetical protein
MRLFFFIVLIVFNISFIKAQEFSEEEDFYNAFIIVVDTSHDYYELRELMFDIYHKFSMEIDTMERGYDKTKDLICLPDDHEDEIYAGDYFPRRFPSEGLSLEYIIIYTNNSTHRNIGLLAGVFESEDEALRLLNKIKINYKKTFIINTDLYMGCMH